MRENDHPRPHRRHAVLQIAGEDQQSALRNRSAQCCRTRPAIPHMPPAASSSGWRYTARRPRCRGSRSRTQPVRTAPRCSGNSPASGRHSASTPRLNPPTNSISTTKNFFVWYISRNGLHSGFSDHGSPSRLTVAVIVTFDHAHARIEDQRHHVDGIERQPFGEIQGRDPQAGAESGASSSVLIASFRVSPQDQEPKMPYPAGHCHHTRAAALTSNRCTLSQSIINDHIRT